MSIKFIVERFKEQDRKQLELIKKFLQYKSSRINENTRFLRKFTLAILQQYNKRLNFGGEKGNEAIKLGETPSKIDLNSIPPKAPFKINLQFKIPQAPSPIRLNIK